MILKKQEIINLPVYTQSGQHLGKVVDFELSSNSHTIEKYIIRSGLIVGGILQKDLLIAPSQIIKLSKEKMTVEDTLTPEQELSKLATAA